MHTYDDLWLGYLRGFIGGRICRKKFFIEDSGEKPDWCIIQTNKPLDVSGTAGVVPWTDVEFFQDEAGAVFCEKYSGCIDDSPGKQGHFFLQK